MVWRVARGILCATTETEPIVNAFVVTCCTVLRVDKGIWSAAAEVVRKRRRCCYMLRCMVWRAADLAEDKN